MRVPGVRVHNVHVPSVCVCPASVYTVCACPASVCTVRVPWVVGLPWEAAGQTTTAHQWGGSGTHSPGCPSWGSGPQHPSPGLPRAESPLEPLPG